MMLSSLLRWLEPSLADIPERIVESLTENTALADPQSLFVCIRGARFDGHELAFEAYKKGCRAFVAERELPLPSDAFVLTVPSTRRAMAALACAFYGHPSHKMQIIGITGTKGKTTVAHMIFHVLNQNGVPCGYVGTNGVAYGEIKKHTSNTTPDAVTLQKTLSEMYEAGIRAAVLEISSQALKQYRADGIRFAQVLFTNLFPDHISPNEHADMTEYANCKRRLFCEFDFSHALYNADDDAAPWITEQIPSKKKAACSLQDPKAAYFATDLQRYREGASMGIRFSLLHGKDSIPCHLPLLGEFNVCNALLAIAAAHKVCNVPLSALTKALETVMVAGRGEILPLPNGATAIIDYAHNGGSLRSLLSALREYAPQRLICLFGSVGERTQLRRPELGKVAAELCDLCILTSDNPGNEDPMAIIRDIATAFADKPTPYVAIADRAEAIRYGVSVSQSGDILVLAGKGHEDYQLIGNQKLPFSERDILLESMRALHTESRIL